MQLGSLLGIIVAFGAVCLGNALEGGHMSSMLQPTAAYIVLGGTFGALLVQFPAGVLRQSLVGTSMLFRTSREPRDLPSALLTLSAKSRRDGLISIERDVAQLKDPFVRRALEMVVDGFQSKTLRSILTQEITRREEREEKAASVLDAAGSYAPTIGVLGAVLGLIHVMENLSDPAKIGPGIATAFVATLYGVGFANLLFFPLAGRLRSQLREKRTDSEFVIEVACSLADGEGPQLLEQRLNAYHQNKTARRS
jgi:chemotaxis protein MotA